MRANRTFEIGTGLFVLLGFAALVFLTTQLPSSGLKLGGMRAGYRVTAEFGNIGQLKVGAPVSMAGVPIGDVVGIGIDPQRARALVTLRIDARFNQIPDDSDASIDTEGLLGAQYVAIGAGGSETYLRNGSRIELTQDAIVLESLVNKLFASFASKPSDSGSGSGAGAAGGAASSAGSASSEATGAAHKGRAAPKGGADK